MLSKRLEAFQNRLRESDIDVSLITDEDNIYYLAGYYDYLHMDFGRPTVLIIPKDDEPILITPMLDFNSAKVLAKVNNISPWNDGMGNEWREEIPAKVKLAKKVGIEMNHIPQIVRAYLNDLVSKESLVNISSLLSDMRMIKSEEELQMARHAGQVASAMMWAGREKIDSGIPEYEVAIATSQAGTRKAAELLNRYYKDKNMSPNTQFLQIMASGEAITQTHHRATNRIMQEGEPVFLCFCGMTNFHRFKLGFDRTFWIKHFPNEADLKVYEVAIESQRAALKALGPGVSAESVHAEYAEVIQTAGYDYPFRCGRATGFSFLEKPELVTGDKTILKPGMVFAVDGSVTVDNFRAQVGDSFIITEDGYESITDHPKSIEDVII